MAMKHKCKYDQAVRYEVHGTMKGHGHGRLLGTHAALHVYSIHALVVCDCLILVSVVMVKRTNLYIFWETNSFKHITSRYK